MTNALFTQGDTVAVCSATGEVPDTIELIPTGDFTLNDGRGTFTLSDPAAVIARSFEGAAGNMLPIDFDHGLDGQGGGVGRAAGWITKMEIDGNRIVASVEWTPAGRAALEGKEYRFLSPVFTYPSKSDRNVVRIRRAGLVNSPAISELKQVASTQEDAPVNPLLLKIAKALGLEGETDESKITASAVSAIETAGRASELVAAAGLTGELTETAATAISTKLKSAGDPDPAKFVPKSVADDLQARCSALETASTTRAVEEVVAAAKADGKLAPAQVDWAKSYAATDMDGFKAWAASAPTIVAAGELIPSLVPAADGALTSEEKAVCAQMGLTEDAFLATKSGKPLPKPEAAA